MQSRYLFLLEREHVVRAPFLRKRTDDWIWLGGTIFVVVTFGALFIWGIITPHAELSPTDGQCRIGIAKIPAYLLLVFDATINAALTIVFAVLLRPVLQARDHASTLRADREVASPKGYFHKTMRHLGLLAFKNDQGQDIFSASIKKVLWRNVIGSSLIFVASAINLIVFLAEKGVQLAFVCLVACMADGESRKISLFFLAEY